MPIYCFYNPANPKQRYWTTSTSDTGIPAGYLDSQGSDGAIPAATQQYVAGINSGGYPPYTGDPTQVAVSPKNPNGVLS